MVQILAFLEFNMDDLLQQLENQIRDLIHQRKELKQVNSSLQQGKQTLSREKHQLIQLHKKSITQIETLISRLKAIETNS